MSLRDVLKQIGADNAGATAVEYGLIVALIVIGIIGVLTNFGNETTTLWNTVSEEASAVL